MVENFELIQHLMPLAAAAGGDKNYLLDFATGVLVVVLLWPFLAKHFFKPHMELIERREASTVGAEQQASELRREASVIEAEIQTSLGQTRMAGLEERLERVAEANKEAKAIISHAEEAAARELKRARGEIAQELAKAYQEAQGEIDSLSDAIAERVIYG